MDALLLPGRQSPTDRRFAAGGRLLLVSGLLVYGLFLVRFMGGYASGADQSGYLNLARLLADGRVSAPMRIIAELPADRVPSFAYVPLGFNPNPDHRTLNPIYAPGLPLLIMAAAKLVGWTLAPGLVLGLHALIGLWLVYLLGRTVGLEAGWAWFGALLVAVSPLYVMFALQTMSDLPSLVWVAAAILSAWKSHQRRWLALVAGAAYSIAVLVRATNVLALLPLAIALGSSRDRWLLLIAGGLPGALFQGGFNLAAYHRLVATGYGDVDQYFSWRCLREAGARYAVWLPVLLTPLGALSLGLPLLRRYRPMPLAWLSAWALVFPGFYLFYRITQGPWWVLRFILPAFPPLAVGALLVAREFLAWRRIRPRAIWLAPVALAVVVHGAYWSHELHALGVGRGQQAYPQMAEWMREHLPDHAVVAAMQTSGALFYYTQFPIIRWDTMPPGDFARLVAGCMAAGRPVYAALHQDEINEPRWAAFPRRLPGHWTQVGAVRYLSLWRCDSTDAAPSAGGARLAEPRPAPVEREAAPLLGPQAGVSNGTLPAGVPARLHCHGQDNPLRLAPRCPS